MLRLRKFTADDACAYLKIANDDNEEFYPFSYCRDTADALKVIKIYNSSDIYGFAIEQVEDKTIVGAIYMEKISTPNIEVGYFIGKPYRRRGYAKFALGEIEKRIKKMHNKQNIEFLISNRNKASIHTVQSFGAKLYQQRNNYGCWRKQI